MNIRELSKQLEHYHAVFTETDNILNVRLDVDNHVRIYQNPVFTRSFVIETGTGLELYCNSFRFSSFEDHIIMTCLDEKHLAVARIKLLRTFAVLRHYEDLLMLENCEDFLVVDDMVYADNDEFLFDFDEYNDITSVTYKGVEIKCNLVNVIRNEDNNLFEFYNNGVCAVRVNNQQVRD